MLFPFLSRKFVYHDTIYYDFETAYGYGGPIYNRKSEDFQRRALSLMYDEFVAQGYVAGFVRFHPLLSNCDYFEQIGSVIMDRKTVAIDLSLSEDEIWMSEFNTKNRNKIKKALKSGLQFIVDDEYKYLSQFIELYDSTMDKLSADKFYYFDNSYFDLLRNNIENSFLGIVVLNEQILSASIFFYEGPYGHYHLSGSNKEFLNFAPNNYLLYGASKELKHRGVKYFHLGGGTTSNEDDPLLIFKNNFSKHQYQFALGKLIFSSSVYQSLCKEWEDANPEKNLHFRHYLLKYKY